MATYKQKLYSQKGKGMFTVIKRQIQLILRRLAALFKFRSFSQNFSTHLASSFLNVGEKFTQRLASRINSFGKKKYKYFLLGSFFMFVLVLAPPTYSLITNKVKNVASTEVLKGTNILAYKQQSQTKASTLSDFQNTIVSSQSSESEVNTFADATGNGRDVTCTTANCVEIQPSSVKDNNIYFDGSQIELEDADAESYLNGLSAFTISVWVKSEQVNTDRGILNGVTPDGNDNPLSLRYDSSGYNGGCSNCIKAGIEVNTSGGVEILQLESSSNKQSTSWQHLALSWQSGEQLQLYIDGKLNNPSDNYPAVSGNLTGLDKLLLGKGAKDAGQTWQGNIDELKIFPQALNSSEVNSIYQGGTDPATPLVHLPFNDVASDANPDVKFIDDNNDYITLAHYGENPAQGQEIKWWDDDNDADTEYNWRYRKCYEIDFTQAAETLQAQQLYFDVPTDQLIADGKMLADGSDIRFADSDGQLLDHYLQAGINTSNTKIWVKTQQLTAGKVNDICMYYGYVPYLEAAQATNLPTNTSARDEVFSTSNPQDKYFVVTDNAGQEGNLEISSYMNNNAVTLPNGEDMQLNAQETYSYPQTQTQLKQTTSIQTTGYINGSYAADGGDTILPASLAGTEFAYRMDRYENSFSVLSPWCDANVEIKNEYDQIINNSSPNGQVTVNKGEFFNITADSSDFSGIDNDSVAMIEVINNCPVLVTHSSESKQDSFPMLPVHKEWYGVPSRNLQIASVQDGTNVNVFYSDGAQNSYTLDRGGEVSVGGFGSQGSGVAVRVVADKPVGVSSIADADGTETTTFLPADELNYEYVLPDDAQYVAIATTNNVSGEVELYSSGQECGSGTPKNSVNVVAGNDAPAKVFFGSTNDGVHVNKGTCIIADVPFTAYYEQAQNNDERNIWGPKQNRQFSYPAPSNNVGNNELGNYTLGEQNSWKRRFPITLTNNSLEPIQDYTFKWEVGNKPQFFSKLQDDAGDFRWAGSSGDGTDNLPYWVEKFDKSQQQATIWLRFPGPIQPGDSQTLYAYVDAQNTTSTTGTDTKVFNYPNSHIHYYLVDDDWVQNPPLTVISGTNNNQISIASDSLTLQKQEMTNLPLDSQVNSTDILQSTSPITATMDADNTDALAPQAFAGKEFVYRAVRDQDSFDIYAPFQTANVTISQSSSSGWTQLQQVQVNEQTHKHVSQNVDNGHSLKITADQPVLVFADTGDASDSLLMYPTAAAKNERTGRYELYGIGSTDLHLAAAIAGTKATIYRSNGSKQEIVLDNNNLLNYQENGNGSQGGAYAYHIVADGPIGATSVADADGYETVSFWGTKEQSKQYILPMATQYIAIAASYPDTTCRLYDENGNEVTSGSANMDFVPPQTGGSLEYPYPNKIFLGGDDTSDNSFFAAGYKMNCTQPVHAYFEKHTTNGNISDETNLLSYPQFRDRTIIKANISNLNTAEEQGLFKNNNDAYFDYYVDLSGQDLNQHTAWKDVIWQGNLQKPETEKGSTIPLQLTAATAKHANNCQTATYNNAIQIGSSTRASVPRDFSDTNCLRVRAYMNTGNASVAPKLTDIGSTYSIPEVLPGILSNHSVPIECTSNSDSSIRVIKAVTDESLASSNAQLIFNSTTTTNYEQFELELMNTRNYTANNQFSFPPYPTSIPQASGNVLAFSKENPLAVYLTHQELFTSKESTSLSFTYDRDSADILRDFEVEIDCR